MQRMIAPKKKGYYRADEDGDDPFLLLLMVGTTRRIRMKKKWWWSKIMMHFLLLLKVSSSARKIYRISNNKYYCMNNYCVLFVDKILVHGYSYYTSWYYRSTSSTRGKVNESFRHCFWACSIGTWMNRFISLTLSSLDTDWSHSLYFSVTVVL